MWLKWMCESDLRRDTFNGYLVISIPPRWRSELAEVLDQHKITLIMLPYGAKQGPTILGDRETPGEKPIDYGYASSASGLKLIVIDSGLEFFRGYLTVKDALVESLVRRKASLDNFGFGFSR